MAIGNALEQINVLPAPALDQVCAANWIYRLDYELAVQICDFLMTITTSGGYVCAATSEMHRAPVVETEDHPPASINPTARIAGYCTSITFITWLERATDSAEKVEGLENRVPTTFYLWSSS